MAKKFTTDSPDWAEIKARKKPNEVFVPILMEPEIKHRIDAKNAELAAARWVEQKGMKGLDQPSSKKLEDELEELYREADDYLVNFIFQDIGRKRYEDLNAKHLPDEAQRQLWKDAGEKGVLAHDIYTFPPALIAACSIAPTEKHLENWEGPGVLGPKITVEKAQEIAEEWSDGDFELLWMGAFSVCKEQTSAPLSRRAIARMMDSNSNSTTALNEESPTPSS